MQYYKGKALYPDSPEEPELAQVAQNGSLTSRFFKILVFPVMICYWTVQNIVYKSLED